MKKSPQKIEKPDSILDWIHENDIRNEKGDPIDYSDRPFLLQILADWSQEIVIKACAQVGKSVTFNLKALFACDKYKWNIIYTMPTDGDVKEFVGTKTNKILEANAHVFPGIQTDNIERKEINGRFIYFKGTVSKSAAISTSSDLNVHDEADRSDQKMLGTYKSRLANSLYKGRWLFSNPTTEKGPVDEAWKKSDQKEWMVVCPACNASQALSWPSSVDIQRKCYQCIMCHAALPDTARLTGEWIPQNPGAKISGYHISQMMRVSIPAESIIEDSEGDPEYFYNFVLGEPYNPGDLSISKSTILDCWTPEDINDGGLFIGVDVGNIKHYVIGSRKGIFRVGRFTKWSELDDLIAFYKPVSMVIDAMPDNTAANHYVEKYPFCYMSFFGENTSDPKNIVWWGEGDRKGIVYSNRNRVLDRFITDIVEAKYLFACEANQDFARYIKHWETMRRIKTVNTRGIEQYEWVSTTNEDHFCFASLYWYLATLTQGSGIFISEERDKNVQQLIGSNNVMGDLAAVMAANNGWDFPENG